MAGRWRRSGPTIWPRFRSMCLWRATHPWTGRSWIRSSMARPNRTCSCRSVFNLTRRPRRFGRSCNVRCSRPPSRRRWPPFDDSVLRLRNGAGQVLRSGFWPQAGISQAVVARPESETLACTALDFETANGCSWPDYSGLCGSDVQGLTRPRIWPRRGIAFCL